MMKHKALHEMISARYLMRELRRLMARDMSIQARLDRIVSLLAESLNVDVCSCYILRPGDLLELYATYGLDKNARHETFLRVGEGLVGEIALQRKPLFSEDAWAHPSFVYKPETNEKAFKSLAGVPLIRSNRLLGVLVIQTKKKQTYTSETIELLETVAMVVAEMLTGQHLTAPERENVAPMGRQKLDAVSLIEGFAIGTIAIHKRMSQAVNLLAKDSQQEIQRLYAALETVEQEINKILATSHMTGEQSAIFDTYLMFLKDKGWILKMTKAIEAGLTAEAAVQKVGEEIAERMQMMTDPYIKERVHDFNDLGARVLKHLRGKPSASKNKKMLKNTILVAKTLGPAELLDYDLSKIKGLILEEGSQTMHMVIVARSLNLPLVCGIKNVCSVLAEGDYVALDATAGIVYVNPSDETLDDLNTRTATRRKLEAKYHQIASLPAETVDGVEISLNINAGLSNDLTLPENTLFHGVGLYRTELPFMLSDTLPDVRMQEDIYRRVLIQAKGRPVVFRTLDIGSDKVLPYFHHKGEENPAMGWRSIRMTLDRRALLRNQLRALIHAAADRELFVMFPMISSVDEFLEAKATLNIELERARLQQAHMPQKVKVGTMIEVPSLIFSLDRLLREVDFVSIGTNDLAQFLFAADRGNPNIWNRYDNLSPALLKALRIIVHRCQEAHIPCSVCGEMAGRPLEAMTLVALGFTSLSMNPTALGPVKSAIRAMNYQQLSDYLEKQLSVSSRSLRDRLISYARDHGILI